jgi:hypothetical protein
MYAHGLLALALVPPPWLRPFSVSGFDLSSGFILRADHAELRAHPAKLKSEISAVEHLRRVLRVRIKRTVKAKQERYQTQNGSSLLTYAAWEHCSLGTMGNVPTDTYMLYLVHIRREKREGILS